MTADLLTAGFVLLVAVAVAGWGFWAADKRSK